MRRIDTAKNKRLKNIKHVDILNNDRVRVVFTNKNTIDLYALPQNYGEDASIFITYETYEKKCGRCVGSGKLYTSMLKEVDCDECAGKGVVTVEKE